MRRPAQDSIRFARGVSGQIQLTSQLVVTDALTIRGPGADRLAVSGGGVTRVFAVVPPTMVDNDFNVNARLPTGADLAESPRVTIANLSIEEGLAADALGFPATPDFQVFAFGGGVYNLGGQVHLNRVQMTNNQAQGGVTAGGAVANEFGGRLSVSRSHFEGNLSSGGLIGVGGAITSDLGPLANEDGAPIGTTGQPHVSVDRSSFVENSAQSFAGYVVDEAFSGLGGGGAILNVTGVMDITRSSFQGNSARGGAGVSGIPDLPDSTSGGAAFGGAILSGDFSPFGQAESRLDVSRSEFVGNTAVGGAGGVEGLDGGVAAGGAVSVGNLGDAEFNRNTFRSNTVVGGDGASGGVATGGGVSGAGGANLELKRNEFVRNSVEGGAGSLSSATGRGGGLGLDSINLAGFVPGPATAEVERDEYVGNVAHGGIGGGIYNEGDLTMEGALLSQNQAIGKADVRIDFVPGYEFQGAAIGGGLSNIGVLDMKHTRVEDNTALGANDAEGPSFTSGVVPTYPGLAVGGGVHNITDATLRWSRITGNQALGGDVNSGSFAGVANGGGIYNDGSLNLTHGVIWNNEAVGGDGNTGDINAGGGYGGGVSSGSVTAAFGLPGASLMRCAQFTARQRGRWRRRERWTAWASAGSRSERRHWRRHPGLPGDRRHLPRLADAKPRGRGRRLGRGAKAGSELVAASSFLDSSGKCKLKCHTASSPIMLRSAGQAAMHSAAASLREA